MRRGGFWAGLASTAPVAPGALAFGLVVDPGRWGLELVFPLTFLGLLMPVLAWPVTTAVALASGVVAVTSAAWLPGKGNLVLAVIVGSGVGAALEGWWTRTQ
jgi:predicted branched-subunit amino acid permease